MLTIDVEFIFVVLYILETQNQLLGCHSLTKSAQQAQVCQKVPKLWFAKSPSRGVEEQQEARMSSKRTSLLVPSPGQEGDRRYLGSISTAAVFVLDSPLPSLSQGSKNCPSNTLLIGYFNPPTFLLLVQEAITQYYQRKEENFAQFAKLQVILLFNQRCAYCSAQSFVLNSTLKWASDAQTNKSGVLTVSLFLYQGFSQNYLVSPSISSVSVVSKNVSHHHDNCLHI